MKKQLFMILLAISVMVKAQDNTDSKETESQRSMTEFSKSKRHSLSLDVIAGLAFPAFNPRYEYVLNKYSGIGADLNINFDNEKGSEILEKFSFSPYYRQYFFSKEDYGAKGFYGEGFLKFYTYENDFNFWFDNSTNTNDKTYFETAVGVGIGWKWVSDSGFLIDINGGLGRNLGFADDPNERDFTGKFGLNFGWQF
ncbi:hypothetical protein SAMN04489761_3106 [Tenacibaculum sp. MAR_2009_124]|uniref:hypothetical protein n=1 Tax=Tenacibaculum sp. MAR_2009_124 TaxID=1250059 RepID=UPI000896842B|nr:hypothetical protein [Tenacibaculum sp. MAR_2009_124]SEC47873.1 hypothetical protein SAMN04489761_3106 [Tenacibaculum sp. MAR_2009_124]